MAHSRHDFPNLSWCQQAPRRTQDQLATGCNSVLPQFCAFYVRTDRNADMSQGHGSTRNGNFMTMVPAEGLEPPTP